MDYSAGEWGTCFFAAAAGSTQNGHSSLSSLQTPGYSLSTMQQPIGFLALAACFILAGALLDSGYQRSTPYSLQAQGTIVDFERGHSRQVYPVFEFKDADGMPHRVVNTTQQAIARFSRGDSVSIAYSCTGRGRPEEKSKLGHAGRTPQNLVDLIHAWNF